MYGAMIMQYTMIFTTKLAVWVLGKNTIWKGEWETKGLLLLMLHVMMSFRSFVFCRITMPGFLIHLTKNIYNILLDCLSTTARERGIIGNGH